MATSKQSAFPLFEASMLSVCNPPVPFANKANGMAEGSVSTTYRYFRLQSLQTSICHAHVNALRSRHATRLLVLSYQDSSFSWHVSCVLPKKGPFPIFSTVRPQTDRPAETKFFFIRNLSKVRQRRRPAFSRSKLRAHPFQLPRLPKV